jgi:hypothetical protein
MLWFDDLGVGGRSDLNPSGQKTRTTIKVRIQLTLKCSDVSNLGRTLRVNCGIESEFTAGFRIGAYRDGQFALHVASGRYAASR